MIKGAMYSFLKDKGFDESTLRTLNDDQLVRLVAEFHFNMREELK